MCYLIQPAPPPHFITSLRMNLHLPLGLVNTSSDTVSTLEKQKEKNGSAKYGIKGMDLQNMALRDKLLFKKIHLA